MYVPEALLVGEGRLGARVGDGRDVCWPQRRLWNRRKRHGGARDGLACLRLSSMSACLHGTPAGFSAPTPWVWDHGLQLAKASLRGELQDSDVV
jgi:hypothetical protein